MELVVAVAITVVLAFLIPYFLPRFSREVLGPLVIVAGIVSAILILTGMDSGRDAWGPGLAIIAIAVGAAGIITGLILMSAGNARARRVSEEPSERPQVYSSEKPHRLPRNGCLSPFVIIGAALTAGIIYGVISVFV